MRASGALLGGSSGEEVGRMGLVAGPVAGLVVGAEMGAGTGVERGVLVGLGVAEGGFRGLEGLVGVGTWSQRSKGALFRIWMYLASEGTPLVSKNSM